MWSTGHPLGAPTFAMPPPPYAVSLPPALPGAEPALLVNRTGEDPLAAEAVALHVIGALRCAGVRDLGVYAAALDRALRSLEARQRQAAFRVHRRGPVEGCGCGGCDLDPVCEEEKEEEEVFVAQDPATVDLD